MFKGIQVRSSPVGHRHPAGEVRQLLVNAVREMPRTVVTMMPWAEGAPAS